MRNITDVMRTQFRYDTSAKPLQYQYNTNPNARTRRTYYGDATNTTPTQNECTTNTSTNVIRAQCEYNTDTTKTTRIRHDRPTGNTTLMQYEGNTDTGTRPIQHECNANTLHYG